MIPRIDAQSSSSSNPSTAVLPGSQQVPRTQAAFQLPFCRYNLRSIQSNESAAGEFVLQDALTHETVHPGPVGDTGDEQLRTDSISQHGLIDLPRIPPKVMISDARDREALRAELNGILTIDSKMCRLDRSLA